MKLQRIAFIFTFVALAGVIWAVAPVQQALSDGTEVDQVLGGELPPAAEEATCGCGQPHSQVIAQEDGDTFKISVPADALISETATKLIYIGTHPTASLFTPKTVPRIPNVALCRLSSLSIRPATAPDASKMSSHCTGMAHRLRRSFPAALL